MTYNLLITSSLTDNQNINACLTDWSTISPAVVSRGKNIFTLSDANNFVTIKVQNVTVKHFNKSKTSDGSGRQFVISEETEKFKLFITGKDEEGRSFIFKAKIYREAFYGKWSDRIYSSLVKIITHEQ